MFNVESNLVRPIAISLSLFLAVILLLPSIAGACEGGGEETGKSHFTITALPTKLKGAGSATITVKNVSSSTEQVKNATESDPGLEFGFALKEWEACWGTKSYLAGETCSWIVKYEGKAKDTIMWGVEDVNNRTASVSLPGEP
jgi:hypothetical protein